MESAAKPSKNTAERDPAFDSLLTQTRRQAEEINELKQQLDWFKRQLFGQKSAKRVVDTVDQGDLLAGEARPPQPVASETITYQRRKGRKQRNDDCVTEAGLRFDDTVPVETINLPSLEIDPGLSQETLTEKVTYRLAQRPGSYVILKYVRPVIKQSGELFTAPAPANVLDKSLADVSFLAGMLVDVERQPNIELTRHPDLRI